ncbi:MAG: hypothetical protein KKD94_02385 [Nanoarchaeota archaeon]|nr:hypothetical protein [Nanoarchaeota archaeon]MBU1988305.1 hypothetical protein [Nanoarchaeota archaeon]
MNKKGFMKIVEATIAVLIILVAIMLLSSQGDVYEGRDFSEILPLLLDEIAQNLTLREEIISDYDEDASETSIEESLKARITNPLLEYSIEICDLDEVCYLKPYPSDAEDNIFASERVVSADIKNQEFAPKKIKFFLWKRSG